MSITKATVGNRARAGASAQAHYREAVDAARRARRNRNRNPEFVANDADASDPTTNEAPRAYSYLPGGWNDYATPLKATSGRMLRYTHIEGDLDARPMWFERGTPSLFDKCAGGEGNKTRKPSDNAWAMPKHVVPVNGLCLAREHIRDELDLMLAEYYERKRT